MFEKDLQAQRQAIKQDHQAYFQDLPPQVRLSQIILLASAVVFALGQIILRLWELPGIFNGTVSSKDVLLTILGFFFPSGWLSFLGYVLVFRWVNRADGFSVRIGRIIASLITLLAFGCIFFAPQPPLVRYLAYIPLVLVNIGWLASTFSPEMKSYLVPPSSRR